MKEKNGEREKVYLKCRKGIQNQLDKEQWIFAEVADDYLNQLIAFKYAGIQCVRDWTPLTSEQHWLCWHHLNYHELFIQ